MTDLAHQDCVPCRGGIPPLRASEIAIILPNLPGWQIHEMDGVPRLIRVFPFKKYLDGLAFSNKIGALADQQDHHPILLIEWGRVTVTWFTHVIGGLHNNDFIMAARTDQIFQSQNSAQ